MTTPDWASMPQDHLDLISQLKDLLMASRVCTQWRVMMGQISLSESFKCAYKGMTNLVQSSLTRHITSLNLCDGQRKQPE